MKKFTSLDAAALLIWVLPIIYLAWLYTSLPAIVPMHFDANGVPNNYSGKSSLITMQAFISGLALLLYLLLRFLPAIDPKRKVKPGDTTFIKFGIGIMIFMGAVSIAIIYAAQHKGFRIDKLIFPLMGLLFAFLGNLMNNIKPNYFAGIRTPWTLESEATWRATHHMAARLWFIGGIAITAFTLFIKGVTAAIFLPVAILVMSVIPIVYSYRYYKKHVPH